METRAAVAYKFVQWEVPALVTLENSKVYQLREKLNKGEQLDRAEKNWITEKVNNNAYFKSAIPLQGYCFDFTDILKRFWVKQYNNIQEYRAIDKTALRTFIYGRIDSIVEIK